MTNKKIDKEKAKAVALSVAIGIAVLVIYLNLLLLPNLRKLSELAPKTEQKRSELERAQSAIANIDNFKKDLASLKGEVDDYEERLPSDREVASVLDYLSKVASSTGVKIIEIKELEKLKRPEEPKKLYDEVFISMTTVAGYHEIGRFINSVESSTRVMKVRDFSITASPGSARQHNVKIIVGAFVLKEG